MPALRNPRQERFAQLVKQGIPPYRAYPLAGYQFDHAHPYRLAENGRVKARIAELHHAFQVKSRVTLQTITEKLDEDRAFARECGQAGAALNATVMKAKLHGLMIDRAERGEAGAFDRLQSADDVLALIRAELGDDVAELLIAALDRA
jgi:hypothetical protein